MILVYDTKASRNTSKLLCVVVGTMPPSSGILDFYKRLVLDSTSTKGRPPAQYGGIARLLASEAGIKKRANHISLEVRTLLIPSFVAERRT